jgi:hypothetical protein
MLRYTGVAIGIAAIVLATNAPAHGFGGRLFSFQHVSQYCPPVAVVCLPVCPVVPVYCVPVASAATTPKKMYAVPKPAPPSQTSEPPVNLNTRPIIRDARSPGAENPARDRCNVGFWNLSGLDIKIKVNGASRVVPRDRAIMLDLGRDFVWHVDGREPQRVLVPQERNTHEIVLR